MEKSAKSLRRILEVSANVGIVVVAVILIGNFVSSKWRTKHDLDKLTAGTKVSLSGVKWEDGTTLVLALQKGADTAMRVRRSIAVYGNKGLDLSRA